jgi:hypothetical protein
MAASEEKVRKITAASLGYVSKNPRSCANGIAGRTQSVSALIEYRAFSKKQPGKPMKSPGERDIQNLAASVMQDPVANGDALKQNEQLVVFAAFRNDLAVVPNKPSRRLNIAQYHNLGGRQGHATA